MRTIDISEGVLCRVDAKRTYSASIQRVARHLWYVEASVPVLSVADQLQACPEIAVVGVVDAAARPLGFVRRDKLFAMIGRPFGRDILRQAAIMELAESAESVNARLNVFAAAVLIGGDDEAKPSYRPLTDDEGRFRGLVAAQDLANYLARITRDDIELAGQLQERLLVGNDLSPRPGLRLEAWSRAAKGVGGDFYFTRGLPGGATFAALCDVSGKGVAASLVVSLVWGLLSAYDFSRGLRRLIIDLNQALVASFHLEKYLTGFFIIADPAKSYLLCADMGHSHAFLYRDGRILSFHGSESGRRLNLPIGVESRIDPILMAPRVKPGDTVFCYSDGLAEQRDDREEEFGEKRLARSVKEAIGRGGRFSDTIGAALDAFRGNAAQHDDMSFLALTVVAANAVPASGGLDDRGSREAG